MSTDEVNHLRATIDQMKNELHEERTRVDALKACLEQEREKYNKLSTSMDQNQPQSIQLANGNKIIVVVFQPAHLENDHFCLKITCMKCLLKSVSWHSVD